MKFFRCIIHGHGGYHSVHRWIIPVDSRKLVVGWQSLGEDGPVNQAPSSGLPKEP
ncbi:hypothetical protein F3Y22_tig00002799pilonHSYRG00090 [Hibiscus syriacus]|uniref:Uncharacterized protein n=1 Tax=Hibiscus syriacus TaxID=106335 RepID=A0A6A3CPV0_HIBSY|nr:hypothetical protein F3Y22_tig00002799pilonHSYRG00090 [Hibiscus syriacus]